MSSCVLYRSVVQTCVMDIVPVPGAGDPGSPSSSSPAGVGDRELMDVNDSRLPEFMVSSALSTLELVYHLLICGYWTST